MFARICVTVGLCLAAAAQARMATPFDAGWRFLQGDAPGAERPEFDDSAWRTVDTPHDWSIGGPFDEKNPTGGAGGFLPAGVGWYRKSFTWPGRYAGQCAFIDFGAVMANSVVWINGVPLGKRPFGYASFRYELTPHLRPGRNVVAVRADNSAQPASRWYSGAGIYRPVRLVFTDPVHIAHWATFVTTPQTGRERAVVRVRSEVVNQSGRARDVALRIEILGPDGKSVGAARTERQTVGAGKPAVFEREIVVRNPRLWDIDSPALYRAEIRVLDGRRTLDEETTAFGIREARFEAPTGFWLNGRNIKIKGVCLHHDAGGLGAAVPLRAWERRLERLKELGVNGIRTAHNPAAEEFLDLCDRMGFLVMDEFLDAWTVGKPPRYDYHLYFREWSAIDTRDMVRRDRNHPSIVVYSAGNEIRDTPNAELAQTILRSLLEVYHREDPTRPVSQALFRPNASHDYDNGFADMLDVVGQNYRENELLAAHRAKPERKILGTENGHDRAVWLALRDNPPYAGEFLWTGIDYLGESRRWPAVGSSSGLLDRTGEPKPRAFERQSWWSDRPMVYIVRRLAAVGTSEPGGAAPLVQRVDLSSDWTPSEQAAHEENVEVYSNCEEVELLLNGKSLGAQPRPADASPRTWRVAYEPGTVRAIGRNGGRIFAAHELRTAGKPARILLSADRARLAPVFDEVAYVTATVVDENGVRIPGASDAVRFEVEGPGKIAAVDSGDNSSHEPFQASERPAYLGRCVAAIRATQSAGRIVVKASAPGLASGSAAIEAAAPAPVRPGR